jgi:signal peptidase I
VGVVLVRCRRWLAVVTVFGDSMAPTYRDGERVLVRRKSSSGVRRGEIVLVERPGHATGWVGPPAGGRVSDTHWIIKRAVALPGDPLPHGVTVAAAPRSETSVPADRLLVLGDNPDQSYDSRNFGYVEPERVFGVVLRRLTQRS